MDNPMLWKSSHFEVVYARESFPRSVKKTLFLAGPTPRTMGFPGWRLEALEILRDLRYDGHVFLPEPRDGNWLSNYDSQVEWEEEGLNRADVILFWVPRELPDMPAFTTNIEWGKWAESGKVVWGAPDWAKHIRYPEYYVEKLGVPRTRNLKEAVEFAISRLGAGALREDGECSVPLHVWKRPEFQAWLSGQKAVGNRLIEARVLWSFYPKPDRLFCYTVWVDVWIASEGRNKTNELVFGRPDVSAALLYEQPTQDVMDTRIVLVRAFRSPVRNAAGFVYELPGGSSVKAEAPLEVAAQEVEEETGLRIDPSRFKQHAARQLLSTLSIHHCTLFSCRLTSQEISELETDNEPHGNEGDSERTYVEVRTLRQILADQLLDWANLGMIAACLD